mmetsp:Transcript_7006/g.22087  ORF Transcript_7006/g.22087 Transcript_7006/m.22087 type:complete len:262 (+) Transcript_7006:3095-3880(+)
MAAAKSAAARGSPWAIATRRASTPAFHYPPGRDAVDSVTVTRGDLDRLKPDEFLNDNLVNFALKLFLKDAAQSPLRDSACFGDLDRDVYAFSSQFYTKMQEQRLTRLDDTPQMHALVANWTRDIDVFAKRLLLVPICEDLHWSLAVVCHPGELLDHAGARRGRDDATRPCLVVLDSLRMHNASAIEKRIRLWLQEEWRVRKPEKPPLVLTRQLQLKIIAPSVPLLRNDCDSGVFLLRYAQEFLSRAAGDAPTIRVTERDVA